MQSNSKKLQDLTLILLMDRDAIDKIETNTIMDAAIISGLHCLILRSFMRLL